MRFLTCVSIPYLGAPPPLLLLTRCAVPLLNTNTNSRLHRKKYDGKGIDYYNSMSQEADANDLLDPRQIRNWLDAYYLRPVKSVRTREFTIKANLARPTADYMQPRFSVSPLEVNDHLIWIDPAGHTMAFSERPLEWPQYPSSFGFELIIADATVIGEAYLLHE